MRCLPVALRGPVQCLQMERNDESIFAEHLARWELVPDGGLIVTHSSRLLPVLYRGEPAMLKIALEKEERWGAALMLWWQGEGAMRVLAHSGDALLMERATGGASLADMARNGRDDEASRIICGVAARLHQPRERPLPELLPLPVWFRELQEGGERHGEVMAQAAVIARMLLAGPRDQGVLHGDLHHGNILDSGGRGWLAIDPKRLFGERAFDFANIFCNPDRATAARPGRLSRQVGIVAESAGLERRRLLQWIVAWAGLSALWLFNDGLQPLPDLIIAEQAIAELER